MDQKNPIDAFEVAKRLSLNTFMQREMGLKHTHYSQGGDSVSYNECPLCGPSTEKSTKLHVLEDKRFYCFSCQGSGSIVDAAGNYWDCTPLEAAKRLTGAQALQPVHPHVTPEKKKQARLQAEQKRAAKSRLMETIVRKVGQAGYDYTAKHPPTEVLNYLTGTRPGQRGLAVATVREFYRRQMMVFLPSGWGLSKDIITAAVSEADLRAADIWKPDKKGPGFCGREIMLPVPGLASAEFRYARQVSSDEKKALRYNSSPWPWFWRGTESKLALVEGFFDMMALIDLYQWKGHILSFPGTGIATSSAPEVCSAFLRKHGQQEVHLFMDGDPSGDKANAVIQAAIHGVTPCQIHMLPEGQDLNDLLLQHRRQSMAA